MNPEHFLDAVDRAVQEDDREALTTLRHIANGEGNLAWQSLVRHADNVVECHRRGLKASEEISRKAALKLIDQIRGKK